MARTHYQTLQVLPTADEKVIQAAYKALVRQFHPDLAPGNTDLVTRINEAYAVLSDPQRRADYDAGLGGLTDELLAGRYRVLHAIATGGFGTTYKAEHGELPGSFVCVKHAGKISPQYEAILTKEAQAMWDLRHHAIPPVRDYLRLDDGSVALVMGYIEGPTLQSLVDDKGPIDAEDVAWIAERIINALMYLHVNGIVHGDLKPLNVIVQEEGHHVYVVDFGLAAVRPTNDDGSIGYTEFFGPPEAKLGMPLLPQSDLYSLGASMIYALTGDLVAVSNKQVPASVPPEMTAFMRRLLHRSPLDRPDWRTEDLMEKIAHIRSVDFGRARSGMKPIRHLTPRKVATT